MLEKLIESIESHVRRQMRPEHVKKFEKKIGKLIDKHGQPTNVEEAMMYIGIAEKVYLAFAIGALVMVCDKDMVKKGTTDEEHIDEVQRMADSLEKDLTGNLYHNFKLALEMHRKKGNEVVDPFTEQTDMFRGWRAHDNKPPAGRSETLNEQAAKEIADEFGIDLDTKH